MVFCKHDHMIPLLLYLAPWVSLPEPGLLLVVRRWERKGRGGLGRRKTGGGRSEVGLGGLDTYFISSGPLDLSSSTVATLGSKTIHKVCDTNQHIYISFTCLRAYIIHLFSVYRKVLKVFGT